MGNRFKSKTVAALLGLVFGALGAHRAYLGQRLAWVYPALALPLVGHALRDPIWWREPAAFGVGLLLVVAWLETILLCLLPVDRWDARFNAGSARRSFPSVWPIVIAMLALMIGTVVLMTTMALALETFFEGYYGRR